MSYDECEECGKTYDPTPEEMVEDLEEELMGSINILKTKIDGLQMFKEAVDANCECEHQVSINAELRRKLTLLEVRFGEIQRLNEDLVKRNTTLEEWRNEPEIKIDSIAEKNRVFLLSKEPFVHLEGDYQYLVMKEIDLRTFKILREVKCESLSVLQNGGADDTYCR